MAIEGIVVQVGCDARDCKATAYAIGALGANIESGGSIEIKVSVDTLPQGWGTARPDLYSLRHFCPAHIKENERARSDAYSTARPCTCRSRSRRENQTQEIAMKHVVVCLALMGCYVSPGGKGYRFAGDSDNAREDASTSPAVDGGAVSSDADTDASAVLEDASLAQDDGGEASLPDAGAVVDAGNMGGGFLAVGDTFIVALIQTAGVNCFLYDDADHETWVLTDVSSTAFSANVTRKGKIDVVTRSFACLLQGASYACTTTASKNDKYPSVTFTGGWSSFEATFQRNGLVGSGVGGSEGCPLSGTARGARP